MMSLEQKLQLIRDFIGEPHYDFLGESHQPATDMRHELAALTSRVQCLEHLMGVVLDAAADTASSKKGTK